MKISIPSNEKLLKLNFLTNILFATLLSNLSVS